MTLQCARTCLNNAQVESGDVYYVCFFWITMSTVHITAFLLPIAAYNGQIASLQVCSLLLVVFA